MTAYDLTSVPNPTYQIDRRHIDAIIWRHALDVKADIATVTAADYAKVIAIPANTWVQGVIVNVHAASTVALSTINVGDSASATQYLSATSTATTGFTAAAATTQKFYGAADYIKVTLGTTAPTSGVIDVTAFMTQLPDYATE
jgi:hypothetical protein